MIFQVPYTFSAVADTRAVDTPGQAPSKVEFKKCLTETLWADTPTKQY